jgi:hypothetical protein
VAPQADPLLGAEASLAALKRFYAGAPDAACQQFVDRDGRLLRGLLEA